MKYETLATLESVSDTQKNMTKKLCDIRAGGAPQMDQV